MTSGRGAERRTDFLGGERLAELRGTARAKLRCAMRTRLARPLLGTDAVTWRNTSRGVQLFVNASLSAAPGLTPGARDLDPLSGVFALGAAEAAADLVGLSPFGRHRIEHRILRRVICSGLLDARRRRLELERWARTPRGRRAFERGRAALIAWFRGEDPALQLRALLEEAPEPVAGPPPPDTAQDPRLVSA